VLLRIKSVASSDVVASEEFFKVQDEQNGQADKALANINGRLFKSKAVQDALDDAVESIKKRILAAKDEAKGQDDDDASIHEDDHSKTVNGANDDEDDVDTDEILSKYRGRLAGSDSEDSDDDESAVKRSGRALSISPSISASPEPETTSKAKAPKAIAKSHMFLPSLTEAGYLSASDSSASDIQDELAPRKNRRGQRERRAIAEKKHGNKARHLAKEPPPTTSNPPSKRGDRNAGWDLKRGAVDGREQRPYQKRFREQLGERNPINDKADEKKKKRDDQGPLHPSWAAKKAAKSKEKSVMSQFSGTKIIFD
jgi:BUD22